MMTNQAKAFDKSVTFRMEEEDYKGVTDAVRQVVSSHGNKGAKRVSQLLEEGINRHLYNATGKRPWVFVVLK